MFRGIIFIIIGVIGLFYFGNAIDSVKASLQMYPMSIEPPSEKISPLLREKMKEMKEVPVIIELTAPTDMAIAQQQTILPKLEEMGFKLRIRIFNVANVVAGIVPSDRLEEIASNPYIKKIMYDGYDAVLCGCKDPRRLLDMIRLLKFMHILNTSYTGKGVTIILIDSGIDVNHSWFIGRVIKTYKVVNCSKTWTMLHGTLVAGVARAVAPDAKFINIVAFNSNGKARYSWLLKALDIAYHLADKYKPCLCSCSWGVPPRNCTEENLVRRAVEKLEKVMPVVFAAGNDGPDPRTIYCPADVDDVITVGAVFPSGYIAWFSSRGPDTYGKEHMEPDVVAVGVRIWSAKAGTYDGIYLSQGTSLACPFVSGIVALMLQKNPYLTNEECLKILEKTAKDLGPKGFDYTYGYGLVQADKALEATPSVVVDIKDVVSYYLLSDNFRDMGLVISIIAIIFGIYLMVREVIP